MRTWTLYEHKLHHGIEGYEGPSLRPEEKVKVIELEPILDLLEKVYTNMDELDPKKVYDLLKKNGRLS